MKTISFAKKLVAGVVSVAMIASMAVISAVSVSAAAGEFKLSADKTTVEPGDSVAVTISVENLVFSSGKFVVEYDESLVTFKNVKRASGVEGMGPANTRDGAAEYGFAVEFDQLVDGDFATFNFTVNEDAKPGAVANFKIRDINSVATFGQDADGNDVGDGTSQPVDFTFSDEVVSVQIKNDQSVSLSVDGTAKKAGDEVKVTINMSKITYGSIMMNLNYDADLFEYVGYTMTTGTTETGEDLGVANDVGGVVKLSAMASPDATVNGEFATITFKVKAGAVVGDKGDFSIEVTEASVNADNGFADITAEVQAAVDTAPVTVTVVDGSDTPGSDTPGSDTPGSDTPGSDTPGSDTPGSGTPGSSTGTGSGSSAPATGDSAPIAVIAFLSLIALAGVVVFAKKGLAE